MQNEDTIIMIKNALLSGDAVASEVLSCLNSLIVSDADPIVGRGDAIEAYSVLRDSRARLPRDESGKRVLSGDAGDKLRERLARVLFHIPLDNLRRRETRVLERDPAASAAPDEERPARTPEPRKPAAETGGQTRFRRLRGQRSRGQDRDGAGRRRGKARRSHAHDVGARTVRLRQNGALPPSEPIHRPSVRARRRQRAENGG